MTPVARRRETHGDRNYIRATRVRRWVRRALADIDHEWTTETDPKLCIALHEETKQLKALLSLPTFALALVYEELMDEVSIERSKSQVPRPKVAKP